MTSPGPADVGAAPAGPHPEQVWGDALWVQALLAVAPHGLGGVHVRAGAGPVRDRWLAGFRALLPAGEPLRRMPGHIADDRLLGGLDLSATLASGRPVAQRGLLAESHGGVVVVPMAERLSAANAGRLAAALDSGEVGFERDGISARWPARFGVLACDEGGEDDHPLAPTLLDRLSFHVDLRALSLRDCGPAEACAADATEVAAARALLPRVTVDDRVLQALCGTALALGVPGLRASQHAVRAHVPRPRWPAASASTATMRCLPRAWCWHHAPRGCPPRLKTRTSRPSRRPRRRARSPRPPRSHSRRANRRRWRTASSKPPSRPCPPACWPRCRVAWAGRTRAVWGRSRRRRAAAARWARAWVRRAAARG